MKFRSEPQEQNFAWINRIFLKEIVVMECFKKGQNGEETEKGFPEFRILASEARE